MTRLTDVRRWVRSTARRGWRWWSLRDGGPPRERTVRFALDWGARIVVTAVGLSLALVLLLRWVPPPTTAFMVREALFHGAEREGSIDQDWVPARSISPQLALAVVAAEDQRFPRHNGFDVIEIRKALREEGRRRGASTVTQQVAKNLFLWPGGWLRKGLEAYLTVVLEALWPKHRILEVYLNVAEFGPGVFGAEAASRRYFGKPAAGLSRTEAARLAAVLPSPKRMSAARPSAYVHRRTREIESEMARLGGTTYLAGAWVASRLP